MITPNSTQRIQTKRKTKRIKGP